MGSESKGQTQRNCEVSLEINSSLEFFLSLVAFSFYLISCAWYDISLLLLEILASTEKSNRVIGVCQKVLVLDD